MSRTEQLDQDCVAETTCEYGFHPPAEVGSHDPEVLRTALIRESIEQRSRGKRFETTWNVTKER